MIYFIFWILIISSQALNASCMKRDYVHEWPYCSMHHRTLYQDYLGIRFARELVDQIPPNPSEKGPCQHFKCSKCSGGWHDYVYLDEDENNLQPYLYRTCYCINWCGQPWKRGLKSWISDCKNEIVYHGYFDVSYKKYLNMFNEYLIYCRDNNSCTCYWPECNEQAQKINNEAYDLFRGLFEETALRSLDNSEIQHGLIGNTAGALDFHGMTISCVCHSFFFSDYVKVCKDIESYSFNSFSYEEAVLIKDKLEDILVALSLRFKPLYSCCCKKHSNHIISNEILFMNLMFNDDIPLEEIKQDILSSSKSQVTFSSRSYSDEDVMEINWLDAFTLSKSIVSSEPAFLVEHGTFLNNMLLYKQAIEVLTLAIKLDSSCLNAYIERALAYFETGQIQLALNDYKTAKKMSMIPPYHGIYIPENKIGFSTGLISGILSGSDEALVEFIPSIFSCCTGIFNGLWAFACNPSEVSYDMIHTAYSIGSFISSSSVEECFQCVVPELKDLSLSWNSIADNERGKKVGFIIGKYGMDLLIPVGSLKGVAKLRDLKRANTMLTLERCSVSAEKQAAILSESAKRSTARAILIESSKKGKVLVKHANVQHHVMQPKHAWDKVLKLTGNVEEDFKKVALLLEEQNIIDNSFIFGIPSHFPKD